MLCMQHTLERGRTAGLTVGAGIAAADGTYAAIAAFGVTTLSYLLLGAEGWLKLIGAVVLLYLGASALIRRVPAPAEREMTSSTPKAFALAYGLTLANPPTILFFAAIFGSIADISSRGQSVAFTLGVLTGSMLWWVILTSAIARVAHTLGPNAIQRINLASGAALIAFGIHALGRLIPAS